MAGVETIHRARIAPAARENVRRDHVQVSFNDYGHLAVRFFDDASAEQDTLVVFDHAASAAIVGFCQRVLAANAGRQPMARDEEMPF